MQFKALYVGKRMADEKTRVSKSGETLPAFKGTRYMFLVNDWTGENGDEAEETFGRTYIDKRDEGDEIQEIEDGAIQLGDVVDVEIRKMDFNVNFFCRIVTNDVPF